MTKITPPWKLPMIHYLLPESMAQTYRLINSHLDYCNSLLYSASATAAEQQRALNNAAHVVLPADWHTDTKLLLCHLPRLPLSQHIYKTAVLTCLVSLSTWNNTSFNPVCYTNTTDTSKIWHDVHSRMLLLPPAKIYLQTSFCVNATLSFKRHLKTFLYNSHVYTAWSTLSQASV